MESSDKPPEMPEIVETVEKFRKKSDNPNLLTVAAEECKGSKKFSIRNASPQSDFTQGEFSTNKENLQKKKFNLFKTSHGSHLTPRNDNTGTKES